MDQESSIEYQETNYPKNVFNCQGNSAFALSLICTEKSLSLCRMQRSAAAKENIVVIVGMSQPSTK